MFNTVLVLSILLVSSLQNTVDYSNFTSWGGSCNTGSSQSPIDINSRETTACPSSMYFKIDIPCMGFIYNETGQDLSVVAGGISTITFAENSEYAVYEAEQFHYHTQSEHTINGVPADLELHIKFPRTNATSNETALENHTVSSNQYSYSVLAILFKEDTSISSDVFDNFPDANSSVGNFKE